MKVQLAGLIHPTLDMGMVTASGRNNRRLVGPILTADTQIIYGLLPYFLAIYTYFTPSDIS